MVRLLEKTHHSNIGSLVEAIKKGETTSYSVAKTYIDELRKTHSPLTVYVYRSLLLGMFQATVGEELCRRTVYNRLVPVGSVYVSRTKLVPTFEQVRTMMKLANPQYRAVLGVLATSGMRIKEVLSRKKEDLEIRNEGYARVRLLANETKGRYKRYTFLTPEVLQWLTEYHQWLGNVAKNSPYLFPGENQNAHLIYTGVHRQIKDLYATVGLTDKSDKSEIYTVHSFRTFSGDFLRSVGLNEKYVLAIVGHKNKLSSESHYLNWEEIERCWSGVSSKLTFLTDGDPEQKKEVERLRNHNGKLELLLERLLERLEPSNP